MTTPVLAEPPKAVDVPAGQLIQALQKLAAQSGVELIYSTDQLQGLKTNGAHGELTTEQAVDQLIKGTALRVIKHESGALVIALPEPDKTAHHDEDAATRPTDAQRAIAEVVVTGSHIRGVSPASPVITLAQKQMHEEGFTDLGEVVRRLPQNFAGGQNPGVSQFGSPPPNADLTGGSSLNLRGLGPDATLTLLNGRRLAYEGYAQAVDISAIPMAAVDRIEIVPDGASAVYGSDAVAGVANVILKRDFNGAAVSARYGTATEGGMSSRQYTATAGTTWSGGGVIATYDKSNVEAITTAQRSFTEYMPRPSTLYPSADNDSVLLSAHQSVGDFLEMQVDALRNRRESVALTALPTYSYASTRDVTSSLVAPSFRFSLPAQWSATLSGALSEDIADLYSTYLTTATQASTSSGVCYCNKGRTFELEGEGPLPGWGEVQPRVAIGAGYRKDIYDLHSMPGTYRNEGTRSSRFAYAEGNVPFVSAISESGWARRFELTAAVRTEDYDSFGTVTTPKAGLVYEPNGSYSFKLSWAKSFKTPTLLQTTQERSLYLFGASDLGATGYPADAQVLIPYGGNPNLDPEKARTWTGAFGWHPESLTSFEMELSYSSIDYKDRVVLPIQAVYSALRDPANAVFITYTPSATQIATVFAEVREPLTNYTSGAYDAGKVVAIVNDQYTNAANQSIKTADLSGSYRFDVGSGSLTARGSVNWLQSSQQNSDSSAYFGLAGRMYRPPHFSGRVGAVWKQGGATASGFVNYLGGVTGDFTGTPFNVRGMTTVDATFSYDMGERGGPWSNMELLLSAQNLLNQKPDLFTPIASYAPNYDTTNYSAVGRFASLTLSKRW